MTKKICQSCKYWELNEDLALNGIEKVSYLDAGTGCKNFEEQFQSWCNNKKIRECMCVWETSLPGYIHPSIKKSFMANWTFGCTNWEEAKGWEALWT